MRKITLTRFLGNSIGQLFEPTSVGTEDRVIYVSQRCKGPMHPPREADIS